MNPRQKILQHKDFSALGYNQDEKEKNWEIFLQKKIR